MSRKQDAIAIQNACNPAGVARTLVAAIAEMHASPDYAGTDSVKSDPAVRLIVGKLADLCGIAHELDYIALERACNE